MNYTACTYLDSIESSLSDLRAAGESVPLSVLRELDRHVEGIRGLWVEYRVPEEEERRRHETEKAP